MGYLKWVYACVVLVVLYGLAAFITLQPNPIMWSHEGRFFFSMVGLVCFIMTLTFPYKEE